MRVVWSLLVFLGLAFAVPVTFTYAPPAGLQVTKVSLRGSFNGWAETPMKQEGNAWSVTVNLDPGEVQYKFFINGQWPKDMCNDPAFGAPKVDPQAEGCVDDGFGGGNAIRIVQAPKIERPAGGPVALEFEHDPGEARFVSVAAGRLSLRFVASEGSVESAVLEADKSYPMQRQLAYTGVEVWRASVPVSVKEYSFRIKTTDDKQEAFGPFAVPEKLFSALDWVSGRVGYQIFPERFWNGNPQNDALALASDEYNFNLAWQKADPNNKPFTSAWTAPVSPQHCCHQYYGGDLEGLLQKIPYLKSLGVTLVYLNPIFDSGSVHGYDTHNYLEVAPRFGNKAILKKVLDEAHKQGMRVIFDFVPNHTGVGFWAFQDIVKRGKQSPYWNWYFIKQWPFTPGDAKGYEGWFGLGSLPKLNTGNPAVKKYLIEVAKLWIRFGFDGVRVDVANEIIDAHGFFQEMRNAIRSVKPDAFLVAEIWQRDTSWLQGNEFDSLMNYAIGRDILLRYAKFGSLALYNGRRALADLSRIYASYPEAVAAMGFNLITSHDTSRLLTEVGGGGLLDKPSDEARARARLAAAMLYALPGVPITFQGDECGFTGQKDPYDQHRYPMQWDKCDAGTVEFYKNLAMLRKELAALTSPVFRAYFGEGYLLAFLRGEPGESEVLAAFNSGAEIQALALPPGTWRDLNEGRAYRTEVKIPGIGWRYLLKTER